MNIYTIRVTNIRLFSRSNQAALIHDSSFAIRVASALSLVKDSAVLLASAVASFIPPALRGFIAKPEAIPDHSPFARLSLACLAYSHPSACKSS
jgi:hypothetical protein